MQTIMLKAKLHRVRVTQSELEYEGSCAIDGQLLEASGIQEYEQIHVYNIDNGKRFITYAIRAESGSGIISVNGAAAHKAKPNDKVIICAYTALSQSELAVFKPTLVYVDNENKITHTKNTIPVQAVS